jgi:hypothetical protein
MKELLQGSLIRRIAVVINKYQSNIALVRLGCSLLGEFSHDEESHQFLATEDLMKCFFLNIEKKQDDVICEALASALCNLSQGSKAGHLMMEMGLTRCLGAMNDSTSEVIMELQSKIVCNLSCDKSFHQTMLRSGVLDIVIMSSLVRTSSIRTKIVCAKVVLNLIGDEHVEHFREVTYTLNPYLCILTTAHRY